MELVGPWTSPRPRLLFVLRVLFGLFSLALFLVGLIFIPSIYFAYLTHWGVSSVLLFYLLSFLSLKFPRLNRVVRLVYVIAWCLEWIIVPIYWTWVFTQETEVPWAYTICAHVLMLVVLLCDYPLNCLYFQWKDLIYAFVVLLAYTAVNIPVTIEEGELYPRVNYRNGWSYLVILYTVLMCIFGFLLGKILDKIKQNREFRNSNNFELLRNQNFS